MDFKGFYDKIIFDVDMPILRKYTGKQGDTKSRGLYVTVTQRNVVIKDLTGLSMRLFYEKPDKTRGLIDGVVEGDEFRIDYTNQMFAVPGVVKAELKLMGADGEVITDKAFRISVDSSIADGSIISKDERGILDRAFELAEDIIPRLELLDVELLEDVQAEMLEARHSPTKNVTYDSLGQRLDTVEAEYTNNGQQDQLKIAKVEKELNNYKSVMSQVNINQEATQKATGYGIVSLPPNAANGQVSGVELKGLTATNIIKNGDFRNGIENYYFKDFNYEFNNNKLTLTTISDGWNPRMSQKIFLQENHKYFIRVKGKKNSGDTTTLIISSDTGAFDEYRYKIPDSNIFNYYVLFTSKATLNTYVRIFRPYDAGIGDVFEIYNIIMLDLTELGFKTADEINEMFPYYFDGTKSTVSAMRLKSVSEDESEVSTAYVVAKDKDGKIAELRSLPNGTKDEIDVTEGKHIKKIGVKENVISGTIIDYADMAEGGTYYAWNDDEETETGVKGDTLGIDATTLIYQLAEPIEMPVQTSGSLVSYPSGTVYVEPFVADAGIYTDKMTVLHQDLPIKVLEKLSKVDFTTGLETELDVSDAVIAEDKLSFTHPDLVGGDIVFYTYEYDRESTESETEIEYYDSRYVIKDSIAGKFYKWQITVADGVPSIGLKEV